MSSPEKLLDQIESRDDFLRFVDALGAAAVRKNRYRVFEWRAMRREKRCRHSADQKPISLSGRSGGMSSPVDEAFTRPSDFMNRTVMNPKSNSDASWLVRSKCG